MSSPDPTPLDLGRAAAAQLGPADWQLEAEPPAAPPEEPPAAPVPAPAPAARVPTRSEAPPPPDRILEALLFVGGPPLAAEAVGSVIRGFTPDRAREAIDRLNQTYRAHGRPYAVVPQGHGYVRAVRPAHRGVREKLFGGPREARLGQPALDVLSLIAYRQPVTKADVDALRGADSAGPLRQLVRLGLVAVATRGEAGGRAVGYGTTPRFLDLFGLSSLDDLPRLAEG